MMRIAKAALPLALLVAFQARADWSGTVRITAPTRKLPEPAQEGKISGKDGKLRLEINRGSLGGVVNLIDPKARTMTVLFTDRKAFNVTDLDREPPAGRALGARPAALCSGAAFAACLTKAGFKNAGSETVNGLKATRWTRDQVQGERGAHIQLWTPDSFGEFALLRQVTTSAAGTTTLEVTNLKKAPQPAADFEVPADFQSLMQRPVRMGPPRGLPKVPPRRPGLEPQPEGGASQAKTQ